MYTAYNRLYVRNYRHFLATFTLFKKLKLFSSQSQSHIATDGQSVSKSWCRALFEANDQIFSTV
jgi:hypothetical protein